MEMRNAMIKGENKIEDISWRQEHLAVMDTGQQDIEYIISELKNLRQTYN